MTVPWQDFAAFTRLLAERSAQVIRPFFGDPALQVDAKDDASPVTVADRRAEEVMRRLIAERYPDHGILGEEFGPERADAEFVWVLDPIDGTVSFATGCPLFGTLIGLLHGGRPLLGAIHQPLLGQLCLGTPEGTTLNGRAVRIRDCARPEEATVLTTDLATVERHRPGPGFGRLVARARLFRTWGDCYGYLLLAAGGADAMLDPIMHPWDLLPLVPVVEGAGGVITGWAGEDPVTADSCVAAGPTLHRTVLELLHA